jgi:crotonobetainyl-CoA:carnitine CoA-transferase CaiB-like acyl-CoA transferase
MKLEGIRVLDLSQFLPGPHFTMMMSDHGADVIRIEAPSGEPTREIGARQDGVGVWFRNTHRGKRSVVLDLKRPEGVAAFLRLAAQADVVVEAFRPGVVDRLGVGYAAVRSVNPRIVYCAISAFGQTGPYAMRPAHDVSIQAESGLLSLNLGADGQPVLPSLPGADMAGSLMAMNGVLMALLRRATTGEGDYIDISMQDSLVSWLVNVVGPVFAQDAPFVTKDQRSFGGNAFYNIYRCADGRSITLGGAEIKFAANLLNALARPDLIPLCRLPPGPGQQPLRDFLAETFAGHTLAHWEAFLAPLDVCWAPVNDLHQGLASAQLEARAMRVEFKPDADPASRHSMLGIPIKFALEPGKVVDQVPALGEHTGEVLREAGCTQAQIDALASPRPDSAR